MNEVTKLALELQDFCEAQDWHFCVIGGLAVQHWGEPRFTKDVDLTLLTGFGGEEMFVSAWLARYDARVPQAAEFCPAPPGAAAALVFRDRDRHRGVSAPRGGGCGAIDP